MTAFVPASDLYDPETGNRIAHPLTEATDADVRAALTEVDR
ncbi:hypothetical protein [Halobaculum sp. P14]